MTRIFYQLYHSVRSNGQDGDNDNLDLSGSEFEDSVAYDAINGEEYFKLFIIQECGERFFRLICKNLTLEVLHHPTPNPD